MTNRTIQAKLLKIKKMKRLFPRRFSQEAMRVQSYNNTSPYALKTRRFRAPDFGISKSSDANSLTYDAPLPKTLTPDSERDLLRLRAEAAFTTVRNTHRLDEWTRWRTHSKETEYLYVNLVTRRIGRVDLFFSGQKWYIIQEDYKNMKHSRSMLYASRERAMFDFLNDKIRWAQHETLHEPIDL